MNFNRMTIRRSGETCQVFKITRGQVGGYATDMSAKRFTWSVPRHATSRFTGSYSECQDFIAKQGAEFMTEHGIPC